MVKKTLQGAGFEREFAAGVTGYFPIPGNIPSDGFATETDAQVRYYDSLTARDLRIYVPANATGSASTVDLRINAASGNLTISIPAATTGVFEDTTHSDSISNGDRVAVRCVNGGGGALTLSNASVWTEQNNNYVKPLLASSNTTGGALPHILFTQGLTYYTAFSNWLSGIDRSTRELIVYRVATVDKLRVYAADNDAGDAATFYLYKNAAATGISLSIPKRTTGEFEDATNTTTTSSSDEIVLRGTVGGSVGTKYVYVSVIQVRWTCSHWYPLPASGAEDWDVGSPNYFEAEGCMSYSVKTETEARLPVRRNWIVKAAQLRVYNNNLDAAYTTTLRKNGADTTISFTVPASTTGEWYDTGNKIYYQDGDYVNWKSSHAATAGTIQLTSLALTDIENPEDGFKDLFCEFNVQHAQSGYTDLFAKFLVRQGEEDLFAKFEIRQAGVADLFSEFTIQHTDYADIFSEFTIQHTDYADLFSEFVVRHVGTADLFSEFTVRQGTADLFSEFTVRQTGTADLFAYFVVQQSGSADLFSEFQVVHWEDLFAEFTVRQSAVVGSHTAWTQVAGPLYDVAILNLVELNGEIYGGTATTNGSLFKWTGDAWIRVAPAYDFPNNLYIYDTIVLNNEIYGATSGGRLLKWNGVNAWTEVAPQLNGKAVWFIALLNGEIYGGTNGGELFKWNGSNAWTEVAPQLNSQTDIRCIVVFNGEIYGGTSPNGKLFKWNGSNAWTEVADQLNGQVDIRSLAVFNGKIYGGTGQSGLLFEWNGSNAWAQVAAQLNSQLFVMSLAVWQNNLYGGTALGGRLFKWTGNAWIQVAPQLNSQTIWAPGALLVFNNQLYAGTGDSSLDDGRLFRFPADALFAKFVVPHTATKDLYAKFEVQQQTGTADLFSEFTVRQTGTADLFAYFEITQFDEGSADLFAKFEIRQAGVADLFSEFTIQHTDVGTEDLYAEFTVRPAGFQDLYSEFTVRRTGYQDLFSTFTTRFTDYTELKAEFIITRVEQSDLFSEFTVRQAGFQDLYAGLIVRQSGYVELKAVLEVAHWQDLYSKLIVRQAGSADLKGITIIRNKDEKDLKAILEVAHWIRLPAYFWVRHPYWLWSTRHYINGVIDLSEIDISDAVLEYVIEGVMVDVKGALAGNERSYDEDWSIVTVPKLIKRAVTYGTVASLYARGYFDHRIAVSIPPRTVTVIPEDRNSGMDFWEAKMEVMLALYYTSSPSIVLWVDTWGEEPVFSMDEIPTYTEEVFKETT